MQYGFVITTAGRALLAKLAAGGNLQITKTMVGKGKLADDQIAADLTDLIEPVALATSTVPIAKDDTVSMIVEYRSDLNGGLSEGFWLNEFGIYAMNGDAESLIYYGTLGDYPQWVSAYKNGAIDVRRYPVSFAISAGVTVELCCAAHAFVTSEELEERVASPETELAALRREMALLKEELVNIRTEITNVDVGYFFGDDGTKYRWGKNDIGVYYEEADEGGDEDVEEAAVVLTLNDDTNTGYFVEYDGVTKPIENAVDSEEELTEGTYNFEII